MAGGWDGVVGWMGDTGVVVAAAGDAVEGGVDLRPDRCRRGQAVLHHGPQLRSSLGGGQLGFTGHVTRTTPGPRSRSSTSARLKDLAGMRRRRRRASSVLGGSLPDRQRRARLRGDRHGRRHRQQPRLRQARPRRRRRRLPRRHRALPRPRRRVGAGHTGVTFVDITAVRAALEAHARRMPAADQAEYEESVKPFLTPFDAFVAAGVDRAPELVPAAQPHHRQVGGAQHPWQSGSD